METFLTKLYGRNYFRHLTWSFGRQIQMSKTKQLKLVNIYQNIIKFIPVHCGRKDEGHGTHRLELLE